MFSIPVAVDTLLDPTFDSEQTGHGGLHGKTHLCGFHISDYPHFLAPNHLRSQSYHARGYTGHNAIPCLTSTNCVDM